MVLGGDPRDQPVPALVRAADEAVRGGLALRLVVAVPPAHDGLLYDALAEHVALVVGSRRLGRVAEVFSESSVVAPLTARAACPVGVVRAPEHTTVHPRTVVVGVDGSRSSQAAVAFAVKKASMREALLRAVWVWPRSLLAHDDGEEGLAERRRLLAESVAGWAEKYPDVAISQEVLRGHPVEQLALTSQESLSCGRSQRPWRLLRHAVGFDGPRPAAPCPVSRDHRPPPAGRAADRPVPAAPLGTGARRPPRGRAGREDAPGPSAGSAER